MKKATLFMFLLAIFGLGSLYAENSKPANEITYEARQKADERKSDLSYTWGPQTSAKEIAGSTPSTPPQVFPGVSEPVKRATPTSPNSAQAVQENLIQNVEKIEK